MTPVLTTPRREKSNKHLTVKIDDIAPTKEIDDDDDDDDDNDVRTTTTTTSGRHKTQWR